METRIFHSDQKPVSATSKLIGDNVWLEFDQGGNHMAICLPARMDAAARMIVEAFNAHIDGGPITRRSQGENPVDVFDAIARETYGDRYQPDPKHLSASREFADQRVAFPTGRAAIAIVAANLATDPGDILELPTGDGPVDLQAARAVEHRNASCEP